MMKTTIILLSLFLISVFSLGQSVNKGSDLTLGKIYTIQSGILNEEREFRVFLPESYDNTREAYPVIYLLDGDAYFLSAWSTINALVNEGRMPASILIAVTSPNRRSDMTPPYMSLPGVSNPNAKSFLNFLADELVPYVDKQYRTRPLRVLIGHSHAALFSMYALTERSNAFKWHLAMDAPMHLHERILEHKVHEYIAANQRDYGKVCVTWNRFNWSAEEWEWLVKNSSQIAFSSFELQHETHASMYLPGIYYGLMNLFSDYQKHFTLLTSLRELEATYTTMRLFYGYEVTVSKSELELGAIEHLVAGNVEEAKPYIDKLQSAYGTSKSEMGDDFVAWMNALIENPPPETRKDYLNRPNATARQLLPYTGTWTNETQYTIEINVVGEKVSGYVGQHTPSGVLKMNIEKCSITKAGKLEIALSNGMTPRSALIIYSLSLKDKTHMEGERTILAFWPKMQAMTRPISFTLLKLK
jgi:hypothetical protein